MKLKTLLDDLDYLSIENSNDGIDIKGIACDSRLIEENFIFIAIKGSKHNGHNFIKAAIKKGAKAVVILKRSSKDNAQSQTINHSPSLKFRGKGSGLSCAPLTKEKTSCEREQVPYIYVADTRKALAGLCDCFFHYPSKQIKTVGITGTNGKTTVSYIIDKILTSAGFNVGLIGTINYKIGNRIIPSTNTTPPPVNLYPLLKDMVNNKIEWAILEVSSHSLDQHRTEGINFDIGVFTNLGSDHLDYHKTKNNYFQSKAKMFKNLKRESFAVINNDDDCAPKLRRLIRAKILNFGLTGKSEIRADNISLGQRGLSFSCLTPGGNIDIRSHLFGRHNVYNILAAIGVALCLNVSLEKIKLGVEDLRSLSGRLELVDWPGPFKVFVDYAHTDDALRAVLEALREFAPGKLYLVFGCGGERDRQKRAKMGKVAATLSDFTILTNDNPRNEDPERIIADIRKGIKGDSYTVILDRYAAIKKALFKAERGDIVLIAGKGHEDYQILKNGRVPFNDREAVQSLSR